MLAMKDTLCPYRNKFKVSRGAKKELSFVHLQLTKEKLDRIKSAYDHFV